MGTEDFVTVPDANGKLGLDKLSDEQRACEPDSPECVRICTIASLKEMLLPGVLAILTPIGCGLLIGARCLGGILMGAIATGFLLAVMMNNAGGAWDNSKKFVENDNPPLGDWRKGPKHQVLADEWNAEHPNDQKTAEDMIDGRVWKKSDWHAAVVTGDTVGDPFKDTSGPALNILIKLMSVLSLTTAKIYRDDWETYWIGIIILVIEVVLCAYIFQVVWWEDDTMATVNANPNAPKEDASAPAPAGVTKEMDTIATTEAPVTSEEAPADATPPENTA